MQSILICMAVVASSTLALKIIPNDAEVKGQGCSGEAKIPYLLHVTAPFAADSKDAKMVKKQFALKLESNKQSLQYQQFLSFKEYNAPRLPTGMKIQYYSDEAMEQTTACISKELSEKGLVNGTYEAWQSLKSGAFKADLWRYLILWKHGGVYFDANIKLEDHISNFVDFDTDCFVTVEDPGMHDKGFWQAMLAASPGSQAMLDTIKSVVHNIEGRMQIKNYMDCYKVTGPQAMYNAIEQNGHMGNVKSEYVWIHPATSPSGNVVKKSNPTAVLASKTAKIHDKITQHSSMDRYVDSCGHNDVYFSEARLREQYSSMDHYTKACGHNDLDFSKGPESLVQDGAASFVPHFLRSWFK